MSPNTNQAGSNTKIPAGILAHKPTDAAKSHDCTLAEIFQ